MKFNDLWGDYHFRNKCGLNAPQFYKEKRFDLDEVRFIALQSYNAGVEENTQPVNSQDAKKRRL